MTLTDESAVVERMTDQLDVASANEERARESARITSRRPEGPAATGYCLHCEEPLAEGRRWCDGDHRSAWERDQARGRRR